MKPIQSILMDIKRTPRSLEQLIKDKEHQRGLIPLELEADLLLLRIKQGGFSGQYLADAFLSMYRREIPFSHSLGDLLKLDDVAFRLFHETLHVRFCKGWNNNFLYELEQRIKTLTG
ncbi:MAG: hypothetical protein WCP96_00835 [Methylococcaceae bacterium]